MMKIRQNETKFEKLVAILLYEKTKGNKIQIVPARYMSHWPNHSHFVLYFSFT